MFSCVNPKPENAAGVTIKDRSSLLLEALSPVGLGFCLAKEKDSMERGQGRAHKRPYSWQNPIWEEEDKRFRFGYIFEYGEPSYPSAFICTFLAHLHFSMVLHYPCVTMLIFKIYNWNIRKYVYDRERINLHKWETHTYVELQNRVVLYIDITRERALK